MTKLAEESRSYPHLFARGRIRDLELSNRVIMAPMESNLATPEGSVSERMLEYYRVRAAGGVGMIIVEYTCVDRPLGLGGEPQLALDEDHLIVSHARLVKAIHAEGAKACVQLFHAGRQTHPKFIAGQQPIAASPIPCPMYRKIPREMTRSDMEHVATKFGEAAERARLAGYDAVEIHGAHGYLPANFLSAASNRRQDEFGGSLENRQRFPIMIAKAVRDGARNIPVIFRLSADEFIEGGTTTEEAKDTARRLVAEGVDALHVSTGCHERIDCNVDPVWKPQGWRIPLARAIREVVSAPVIAVGVIREPQVAERALEDGSADFIALGRALLADPDWPNKARDGRTADIRPCTSCNWCVAQIGTGHKPVGCAENPLAGREIDLRPVRVDRAGRAVVIGSGPAGTAAALSLRESGYQVTLIEQSESVAPGLLASGAAPKKDKFFWYRDYLIRKLNDSGIDLRLNTMATAEMVVGLGPEITVVATGSSDRRLGDVSGLDMEIVSSAYDVLVGKASLRNGPIVIYGAGEIGCEAAKFAAERGFDVILSTRSSDDQALSRSNWLRIYREQFVKTLKSYPNIRIELGTLLKSVQPGRVTMTRNGSELVWDAGHLLLAVGRVPESRLADELKAKGIASVVVGDARDVRRIGDAVHEAYAAVTEHTRSVAPHGDTLHQIVF
ncbi:2,4-dienoyl-CoA reductase-like NADH-dependent reductase (Old Yellow Enzyme family)/thioredoxin reductase [Rhodoligotrophos appendicifer]|uniref:oxidoreductase n=1 Tax=Rhodoligotrophos appendicifer TaxID=987056 RepID=UPI001184E6EA|nr:FAD-dependent oxidoreductase [Rhodoligotrophos appendicifer]